MSAIKDSNRKTWRAYIRYIDWQGKNQIHTKRGFKTKREALAYEREFLMKKTRDINMGFCMFVEQYLEDMKPRLKYNTFLTKKHIIATKIIPYFENRTLADIDATDIIQWQNELLKMRDENDRPYSQTYLRTIQNQLSAIFNHACRFYALPSNPSKQAGKMGKAKAKEMLFWTKDEYLKFSEIMKKKPISFYAFEILYWTGIREGELLALQRKDIDLVGMKLTVSKSYQRLEKRDYVTTPKTDKSNRVIDLPQFLCEELEDYFGMLYKCDDDTRLFEISKSYLHNEMDRGVKAAGVKRIRIHDISYPNFYKIQTFYSNLPFLVVLLVKRFGFYFNIYRINPQKLFNDPSLFFHFGVTSWSHSSSSVDSAFASSSRVISR